MLQRCNPHQSLDIPCFEVILEGKKKGLLSTMHLNIKSDEAHTLAVKLAQLTGESITTAVIEAIRDKLVSEERRRNKELLAAELLEIGRRCATLGRHDFRSHGEFLYDEHGLPR